MQILPILHDCLEIGPNWLCCLAGSFQRAPRIVIFSIAMGSDYSFYVKTIETHPRAFFKVIIFSIGSVALLPWSAVQLFCSASLRSSVQGCDGSRI